MNLSIIIVNYNVKYFVEQCIHSIQKAVNGLSMEIFVVDNNSVDGSVRMIREKFPDVHLIENKDNKGFSRANNQAIRKAKGEYILVLNPDTILEDDTLTKCTKFMDEHPDAGGLGVKMIDGKGKFLPESKRGLPSPSVAFFKMFGFSSLFPRSKLFNKYHLGYLDKNKTHEVDVLAGAFMMLRKSVLNKIGLLDEDFFMYGEDIDLSYRITQAGYKNYYFPGTRIIHYKGESTKKSSMNYVFMFYTAMIIFARKHFSKENARIYSLLINLAIYLHAFLSIATRFLTRIALPFSDALLIYGGIWFIKNY
ncbi:MAG: glycosyltransferase family 2 protein, partial [Bacteroidia bacterium]|nr:glycosyltransferase family 2 protein [Bacteroidia bacterium]